LVGKLQIENFQSLRGSNTQDKPNFKIIGDYFLMRSVKALEGFDAEILSFLT
jgi:hypothetical protein